MEKVAAWKQKGLSLAEINSNYSINDHGKGMTNNNPFLFVQRISGRNFAA